MDECLDMNGGGPWQLGPGQITEKSEMALCLLHGLIIGTNVENKSLDYNAITYVY